MPASKDRLHGTLDALILKTLTFGPRHGYGIVRWLRDQTRDGLPVEEGSLYPALQKLLLKGWVKAAPAISDSGRAVREYRLTTAGRKQLDLERANYRRVTTAIDAVLEGA